MIRFLLWLLLAITPAYAQTGSPQTKPALTTEINTNFPDNTLGLITPALLRQTTLDMMTSAQQYRAVNPQTGTTYTVIAADYGQLITLNNAAAVAVSLPQGTAANGFFPFNVWMLNLGNGTVTVTSTGSNIAGQSSLSLPPNTATHIVSDGTNYQAIVVAASTAASNPNLISIKSQGAVCDGVTDDTAKIQAAGNAAIAAGKQLFIDPSTTGCVISQAGVNAWCLQWTAPIQIVGLPGFSILLPAAGLANTVDIIDVIGNSNGAQRLVVDGVFIGNPSNGTRTGRHALRLDTPNANQGFLRPQISRNYFATPTSGTGTSIFVSNNAGNNANGGTAYANISENLIGSGISLNSAGDSNAIIHNTITSNGALTPINVGIYANLVSGAGNLQVNRNNCGINQTCLQIDCANTYTVTHNEFEHNNAGSTNALINLSAGVCAILGGSINTNELTITNLGATGNHPLAILVANNNNGVNIDANQINVFVSTYAPVQLNAGSVVSWGCLNTFPGTSTANHIIDNSTGTNYCARSLIIGRTIHAGTCAAGATCWVSDEIQPNATAEASVQMRFPAGLGNGAGQGKMAVFSIWSGNGAPGAGQSYTVTMRHNTANSTATCTISGAASNSCGDASHPFTVVPGDTFNFSVVVSAAAATLQDVQWTVEYDQQ